MQQAYENFIVEITSLNHSDKDYQLIYRSLNLTRIDFQSLFCTSRGKNALKNLYLQKAISGIDAELTLLETRFTYPERFTKEQIFKSDPKGLLR